MNIIIAGHPDDELIGCYGLIKRRMIDLVVYLDAPMERLGRAFQVGEEFGFKANSIGFKDLYAFLTKIPDRRESICFVPDVADRHPLHKAINLTARMSGCRLGYYTTDMNTGYTKELLVNEQEEKRKILNKFYPDQKSLWENDWKYFLFEGVVIEFPVESGIHILRECTDLAQECCLYSQGIINEISPETIKKLREMDSDILSLTREEMQERFEEIRDWLDEEEDI